MKRFSLKLLLLFSNMVLLLSACATSQINTGTPLNSIITHTTMRAVSNYRTKTAADTCPPPLDKSDTCLTPYTFRQAYGVQSLIDKGYTGKGQTVLILVSFGSPVLQQSLDTFDKTYTLPPIDLQVISPINAPEQDPHYDGAGWSGETVMDVEIVHAIAPDAKVIVMVSPVAQTQGTFGLPEFRQLEQYIIDHQLGTIVSQSWGASDLSLDNDQGKQELQQWDSVLQNGTKQHNITYISSSGDGGATDFQDDQRHLGTTQTTNFPADNPWVTSVGGTTLTRSQSGFMETAWHKSSGGFSRFSSMPNYQKVLPAATQSQFQNRRGVPDVSAAADPNHGASLGIFFGDWDLAYGTSSSAPTWAGIMAIANQMAGHPLGFINPALYKIAASNSYHRDFHDVTQGNNTNESAQVEGFPAVSGWDPVTGLGTPDAENLIPDLINSMKQ